MTPCSKVPFVQKVFEIAKFHNSAETETRLYCLYK